MSGRVVGIVEMSIAELAAELGLAEVEAEEATAELERAGFVRVERRCGCNKLRVYLTMPEERR
jgi:hypothetical protein